MYNYVYSNSESAQALITQNNKMLDYSSINTEDANLTWVYGIFYGWHAFYRYAFSSNVCFIFLSTTVIHKGKNS